MIKAVKVQLKPNNKQNSLLFQCAGTSRWAYNWALGQIEEIGEFIADKDLRKRLTQLKKKEFTWLNNYSNNITKQAVKDACAAYMKFLKIKNKKYSKKTIAKAKRQSRELTYKDLEGYPNFKSKRTTEPAFYHDNIKIKFTEKHVQLEKIGKIKLAEFGRIPPKSKYSNPRITFDGLHWWISVGIEIEKPNMDRPISEPIGIDLGVKDLAVISNGQVKPSINKSAEIRKSEKRLRRLQRRASRSYQKMKEVKTRDKSANLLKLEKEVLKTHQRLTNIRTNYIHTITTDLVITKPEYVAIENLNIKGMMSNKHLSKAIAGQKLYEFRRQLEYKCSWYDISLRVVDRFYPSSKKCSCCGNVKKDLKLSVREYRCDECGLVIDRDLNAAINLKMAK